MSLRSRFSLAAAGAAVLFVAACTAHSTPSAAPGSASTMATVQPTATAPPTPASAQPTGPATAPPRSTRSATGGSITAVGRCHTGQLRAETVIPTDNGAAGQRYALLGLVNSGAACRMFGYPGLQARDAAARNLPTDVRREPSPPPTTFILARGATAWASLHWTIVPAADEPGADCEPATDSLWVTPPDETSQLSTAAKLGPICQHNQIGVGAMTPHRPF